MNSPGVWQLFRPLVIAGLVAILLLAVLGAVFLTYADYVTYSYKQYHVSVWDLLGTFFREVIAVPPRSGPFILMPVAMLMFAFFIGKRFHLVQYAIGRFGYRLVGSVAYLFIVISLLLIERAVLSPSPAIWLELVGVVFFLLPGLLLLVWWGLQALNRHFGGAGT